MLTYRQKNGKSRDRDQTKHAKSQYRFHSSINHPKRKLKAIFQIQDYDSCRTRSSHTSVTLHGNLNALNANGVSQRLTEVVVNSTVTSPRQRNRIRTNPWLPGSNLSPGNSSTALHLRQDQLSKTAITSSP